MDQSNQSIKQIDQSINQSSRRLQNIQSTNQSMTDYWFLLVILINHFVIYVCSCVYYSSLYFIWYFIILHDFFDWFVDWNRTGKTTSRRWPRWITTVWRHSLRTCRWRENLPHEPISCKFVFIPRVLYTRMRTQKMTVPRVLYTRVSTQKMTVPRVLYARVSRQKSDGKKSRNFWGYRAVSFTDEIRATSSLSDRWTKAPKPFWAEEKVAKIYLFFSIFRRCLFLLSLPHSFFRITTRCSVSWKMEMDFRYCYRFFSVY